MNHAVMYDGHVVAAADLPEGTKKIAVVHRANDGSLSRVDDHSVSLDTNDLGAAAESGGTVVEHYIDGELCYEIESLSAVDFFKGTGLFGL